MLPAASISLGYKTEGRAGEGGLSGNRGGLREAREFRGQFSGLAGYALSECSVGAVSGVLHAPGGGGGCFAALDPRNFYRQAHQRACHEREPNGRAAGTRLACQRDALMS